MNVADLRQLRFPRHFRIRRPQLSLGQTLILAPADTARVKESAESPGANRQAKFIAEIATELWRLQTKMTRPNGEPKDEMRKTYRHVESALDVLAEAGVEIQNHTGQPYRTGLAVETLAFQPTADVARETIIETLRPSVYMDNKQIQRGQVIVGTPVDKE